MSEIDALHVEILTFEGCPNAALARERVREALSAEHVTDVRVENIDVPTNEDAQRLRFLGSPTVRVNGEDVDAAAKAGKAYGLMCRTYPADGGIEGAPSVAAIRAAIRRAAAR